MHDIISKVGRNQQTMVFKIQKKIMDSEHSLTEWVSQTLPFAAKEHQIKFQSVSYKVDENFPDRK